MHFSGDEMRHQAIQRAANHAAEGKRNHTIERVGSGARVEISKRMQEQKHQPGNRKTYMPLQRGVQLTNCTPFVRAAPEAKEYPGKHHKQCTHNSITITGNAVRGCIIAIPRIPEVKGDAPTDHYKRDKQAYNLAPASIERKPGIASFTFVLFSLIPPDHTSSHPERSRRTLSHIIIASRCSPTGQGATHAPH